MYYTPSNKSEDVNLWPFLGSGVKSAKQEAPDIYLHFCNWSKNLILTILAPNMQFLIFFQKGFKSRKTILQIISVTFLTIENMLGKCI